MTAINFMYSLDPSTSQLKEVVISEPRKVEKPLENPRDFKWIGILAVLIVASLANLEGSLSNQETPRNIHQEIYQTIHPSKYSTA